MRSTLSRVAGRMVIGVILLAGIAINAIAQAFSSLLSFYATDTQIRSSTLVLSTQARAMNAFLTGESEAFHLGIRVETVKRLVVVLVAMAAKASVA